MKKIARGNISKLYRIIEELNIFIRFVGYIIAGKIKKNVF